MHIEILLVQPTKNSTLCKMLLDSEYFSFVIEDGYRAVKVPGETRIPDGTYKVVQRTHGKFYEKYKRLFGHQFVPQIADVPGFQDILFHCGNTTEDTRGCILPNKCAWFNSTKQVFEGSQSSEVFRALHKRMAVAFAVAEPITVTLKRDLPNV